MGAVTVDHLPQESALWGRLQPKDFIDCYSVASDLPPKTAAQIVTSFPRWARVLIAIRNTVTAPLGLSQGAPDGEAVVGFFPIESETTQEVIAGFNDKHLDFRVSVMSEQGRVYLSTWVHPHGLFGKLYLKTILPFHILIARDALARVRAAG